MTFKSSTCPCTWDTALCECGCNQQRVTNLIPDPSCATHAGTVRVWQNLDQGTPEWLAARCGILTASVIGRLITPTLKVAANSTSRGLVMRLAAERVTSYVDDIHTTPDMWRGIEGEPLARDMYAEHHAPVDEIGFMTRTIGDLTIGYSPDGLVGDDGLIEIKSRRQQVQVEHVLADQVPAENMAQIQCGLFVSGRAWLDYVSYSSGMALWVKRVTPDPKWKAVILAAAAQFEHDATAIVTRYCAAVDGLPVADRTPYWTEMTL